MQRFLSRKFLLALGGFITLIAQEQYPEAVAVLIAFLTAEGIIDAKSAQ